MARSTPKAAKKSPKKSPKKATPMNTAKTEVESDGVKVLIVPDEILKKSDSPSNPRMIRLRHPKTDSASFFLFNGDDSCVYEILKFDDHPRSWFMGDSVQADGSMRITTPVDPLFLILPYLQNCSTKFMLLDQIVEDEVFPECRRLVSCSGLQHISSIADIKKVGDQVTYRLNQDKVLEWLKMKVNQITEALKVNSIDVKTGARSASYVQSKKESSPDETCYVKYAHGLLADYISDDLSEELKKSLGIEEKSNDKKRESISDQESPPLKKTKRDKPVEPLEDYSKDISTSASEMKKPQKLTAAQKALNKVDKSGMKSLSSFFKKK